jgi:hypothetical protein
LLVEVADGQQVHAVEQPREQQRGDHQAHRRAEGVAGDAAQAILGEGGRYRQHRFGPEPGGEHGGHVHVQWQRAAGDQEVLGNVDAAGRQQPNGDGQGQVKGDESDEHDRPPKKPRRGV